MTSEAQLFEQIGRVSTEFAALEQRVGVLLTVMLDAPLGVSTLLIHPMGFSTLSEHVLRLAKVQFAPDPDRVKRYKAVVKSLKSMVTTRNLFVHGRWSVQPPTCTVMASKLLHSPDWGVITDMKITTMSLSDLMNLINEIHTLKDRVSALITELVKEEIAKADAKNKADEPSE